MNKTNKTISKNSTQTEKASYTLFVVGQNIAYIICVVALTRFWTDAIGIAAMAVGTIMLVAKIWSAMSDLVFAGIVQKVGVTKYGLYKPWTILSALLLPFATIMIFTGLSDSASASSDIMWASVSFIAFQMIYTISDSPRYSLAMTMEPDLKQRRTIFMLARVGAGIAGIITSFVFFALVDSTSYFFAACMMGIIMFLFMIPVFFIKERNIIVVDSKVTIKSMLGFINRNKYIKRLGFSMFFLYAFGMSSMVLQSYVITDMLGQSLTQVGIFGLVGGLSMIVTTIIVMNLIGRLGKRKTIMLTNTIGLIMIISGSIITWYTLNMWTLLISSIGAILVITPPLLYGIFISDCIEYGEYVTGERQEAVGFATKLVLGKTAAGIAAWIGMLVLVIAGFESGADVGTQTEAGQTIFWCMEGLSVFTSILVFIFFNFVYVLGEEEVEEMALQNIKNRENKIKSKEDISNIKVDSKKITKEKNLAQKK